MNYKRVMNGALLLPVICMAISCNTGAPQKTVSTGAATVDSILKNNDSLFSGAYSTSRIKKLLSHFSGTKNFPVSIDSAYMANVAKGHDSLGTNEVKMLVRLWHDDELLNEDSSEVCDFYILDSLKAHQAFTGQYKEGRPTYSNAYGLQQIGLPEETLLVWALVAVQEDADPTYRIITVYYTILNNNTILETGIMGRYMTGADPPGEYNAILSSALTGDGKLRMEQNEFTGDIDSLKGETKITYYEYLIHHGYTELKSKKQDAVRSYKI